MANFDKYAPKLKQFEGGFVNDPADPGGCTMAGVTLSTFRVYYGEDKTAYDLKRMTDEQWSHIMKSGYWDRMRADDIKNQSVAELCVDWLINSGSGKIKTIQSILGCKADGIVGVSTIAALNGGSQQRVHYLIKQARIKFYCDLVAGRSSYLVFFDGWINRIASFCFKR